MSINTKIKSILKFLKQLFCRHLFTYHNNRVDFSNKGTKLNYICQKCDKEKQIWISKIKEVKKHRLGNW